MNVLDSAKKKMRELSDKADDLSGPAGEKLDSAKSAVAKGVEGAGKFADEKTGGKYASKIHTGVDKAKGFLGQKGEKPAQPPETPADSGGKGPDQPSS